MSGSSGKLQLDLEGNEERFLVFSDVLNESVSIQVLSPGFWDKFTLKWSRALYI